MLYALLKHILVGPWVRLATRPSVTGREHVPRRGPVVIAANHLAEVDSLVLGVVLPRRVTFVAKMEYFRGRGSVLYRWLCRATGQIPVDRSGGRAVDAALAAAHRILDGGGAWAIYPEGTRSPDARLHRGHTGVVRVALARPDSLLVPVGLIRGAQGDYRVIVGAPVDLSPWRSRPADPDVWREATDHLMTCLQQLTGQEYVDRYAPRRSPDASGP